MFYFCGVHLCAFFNIRNLASFSGVCLTTIGLGLHQTPQILRANRLQRQFSINLIVILWLSVTKVCLRSELSPSLWAAMVPWGFPLAKYNINIFILNAENICSYWSGTESVINSLATGGSECNSQNGIFNIVLLIGIFRSSHDNALGWMAWCCTTLHPLTRILTRYVNGSINMSDNIQCSSWTHGVTYNLHTPCVNYPEY